MNRSQLFWYPGHQSLGTHRYAEEEGGSESQLTQLQETEPDWNQASAIVVGGERGQSSPAAECGRSYFGNLDLDWNTSPTSSLLNRIQFLEFWCLKQLI